MMEAPFNKYYNYLWFDPNLFSDLKKRDSFTQINYKFCTLLRYINSFHFCSLSEYINTNDIQEKISFLNLPIVIIYSKELKNEVIDFFRRVKKVKAFICYSENTNDIEILKSFSSEKYLKTASSLEELENHLRDLVMKEYSKDFLQVNEMNVSHVDLLNEDRNVKEDFDLKGFSFEKMLFVAKKIEFSDPFSFYIYKKTLLETEENNIHLCSLVMIDENMNISNSESLWDYYFFEKELSRTKVNYCPENNFIFFKDNVIKTLCNNEVINKDLGFIYSNYISKLQEIDNTQELCKKVLSFFLLKNQDNDVANIIFNKMITNCFKSFNVEMMEKLKHLILAIFLNFHKSYSSNKKVSGKAYKYINLCDFDCLEEGKIFFFNQFLTTNLEKLNSGDREMENWVYKNKNTKIEIELNSFEDTCFYDNYIDISDFIKINKPKEKVILFAPFTSFSVKRIEINPLNSKRIITLSPLPINNLMNFNLSFPLSNMYNDKMCQNKIVAIVNYLNSAQIINEASNGNPSDYFMKLNQALGKLKANCGNFTEAISFYSKAYELKGNNFTLDADEFLHFIEIGYCFLDNDQYDMALKNFKKAEEILRNSNIDKIYNVKLFESFMDYYEHMNNKKKTIEFMKFFLETKILYEGKYSPNIASSYLRISKFTFSNGDVSDFEYSLDLLFRCRKIYKGKHEELGKISFKVAKIYKKMKMYDQAIEYILQAKDSFSKLGENNPLIAIAYYHLSNIYFILGKFDLAMKIFHLGRGISKENRYSKRKLANCESQAFTNICHIYLKKITTSSKGLEENILNEAIAHSENFLKILKKSNKPNPKDLGFVYQLLSKLYGYKKDFHNEKNNLEHALIVEKGVNEYSEEVYRLYIELTKVVERMPNFPNKLNDLEQCYSYIIEISSSYINNEETKKELEKFNLNLAITLFSLKKFSKARVYFTECERIQNLKGNPNDLNYCKILKFIGICFFEESNISEAEKYFKRSEDLLNKFSYKFFSEIVEVYLYQAKVKMIKKNYEEALKILNEACKTEKLEIKRLPIYECFLDIYRILNKTNQLVEIEMKICEIKVAKSDGPNKEILNYYEKIFKHYTSVVESYEKMRRALNEKDKLYYIEYNFRQLLLKMKLNLKGLQESQNKLKNRVNEISYLSNIYSQYEDSRMDIHHYKEKLQEECNM
jgi:tetratricopeptide (TPR) repeat protein